MGWVWSWLGSWWHWMCLSVLEGLLPEVWQSLPQFCHQRPVNRIRVEGFHHWER